MSLLRFIENSFFFSKTLGANKFFSIGVPFRRVRPLLAAFLSHF